VAGGLVCWVLGPTPPAQFGLDGAWGVKLDGDAAVSARLGERRSGRMPGLAQMPDRAGAAGRVLAGQAGPGGCQVGAVVAGEEATSNKIGL